MLLSYLLVYEAIIKRATGTPWASLMWQGHPEENNICWNRFKIDSIHLLGKWRKRSLFGGGLFPECSLFGGGHLSTCDWRDIKLWYFAGSGPSLEEDFCRGWSLFGGGLLLGRSVFGGGHSSRFNCIFNFYEKASVFLSFFQVILIETFYTLGK